MIKFEGFRSAAFIEMIYLIFFQHIQKFSVNFRRTKFVVNLIRNHSENYKMIFLSNLKLLDFQGIIQAKKWSYAVSGKQ